MIILKVADLFLNKFYQTQKVLYKTLDGKYKEVYDWYFDGNGRVSLDFFKGGTIVGLHDTLYIDYSPKKMRVKTY